MSVWAGGGWWWTSVGKSQRAGVCVKGKGAEGGRPPLPGPGSQEEGQLRSLRAVAK